MRRIPTLDPHAGRHAQALALALALAAVPLPAAACTAASCCCRAWRFISLARFCFCRRVPRSRSALMRVSSGGVSANADRGCTRCHIGSVQGRPGGPGAGREQRRVFGGPAEPAHILGAWLRTRRRQPRFTPWRVARSSRSARRSRSTCRTRGWRRVRCTCGACRRSRSC